MNAPIPLSQIAVATDEGLAQAPIVQPYLLVMFSVPFHVDATGRRWIDALWAKDLIEHTRYIKQLTLAAFAVRTPPPPKAMAMDEEAGLRDVRCVELPAPGNVLAALVLLPRTCAILWRELGRTKIVHSGVAGWPLPEAWLLVPMLWLRRRILYLNVESAFWRLVPGENAGLRRRVRAGVSETLNRLCVDRSDISSFTHEGYRRTLLRRGVHRGHVVEASWIDEANLLSESQLTGVIERRRSSHTGLRMVFAGRLTYAKGISLLLDAVTAALRTGVDLELDVFGEGPLEAECAARLRQAGIEQRVRLRGSLPYDHRFFRALREHDVLIVPTISDEQPRIVFDAFSQGLPVIASRTDGLTQCVEDGVTGLLFDVGDVAALQARISGVADDPGVLTGMSRACLIRASRLTHQQMHRTRWRLLVDAFPALARTD